MKSLLRVALIGVAVLGAAGCPGGGDITIAAATKAIPAEAQARMASLGMKETSPIFIRIFKEDSELEIWKEAGDGFYQLFKTYPICKWSGELGPKLANGDAQSPEGFYTITPGQMNPKSAYHLAFNLGYPNNFDRANGRTGSALMVHGNCKSIGCYAMTDALIEEIYAIAREAFSGGQREFPVHAYPFRMTDANMFRHRDSKWLPFWRTLKEGYEAFEIERKPPAIAVCSRQYLVNASFMGFEGRPDPAASCPQYVKRKPDLIASVLRSKVAVQPMMTAAAPPVSSAYDSGVTQALPVATPPAAAKAVSTPPAAPVMTAKVTPALSSAVMTAKAAPDTQPVIARAAVPPRVDVAAAAIAAPPRPAIASMIAPVVRPTPVLPAAQPPLVAVVPVAPPAVAAQADETGMHNVRKSGKGDMIAVPPTDGRTSGLGFSAPADSVLR